MEKTQKTGNYNLDGFIGYCLWYLNKFSRAGHISAATPSQVVGEEPAGSHGVSTVLPVDELESLLASSFPVEFSSFTFSLLEEAEGQSARGEDGPLRIALINLSSSPWLFKSKKSALGFTCVLLLKIWTLASLFHWGSFLEWWVCPLSSVPHWREEL